MVFPWVHPMLLCFSCCLDCLLENFPVDRLLYMFWVTLISSASTLWCFFTKLIITSSDLLFLKRLLLYHIISVLFYIVISHYYDVNFVNNLSFHRNCLLLIFLSVLPSTVPHQKKKRKKKMDKRWHWNEWLNTFIALL